MSAFPIEPIRQAFLVLPEHQHQAGEQPVEIGYFYVPIRHAKALHPDNVLVEGIRGAGKSEWWLELQDPDRRQLVAELSPGSELANVECSAGFGLTPRSGNYPSKKVLASLLTKVDAQTIWQTIAAWNILGPKGFGLSEDSLWADKVGHFQAHYEMLERELIQKDNELARDKKKHIVLFDALDRTADDWRSLKDLLKGLLQVALEFRSYKAIRLKIFVRPDMLEDPAVSAFPDGSKIVSNKVLLEWNKLDLYNLLWQYLGNAPQGGEAFRNVCRDCFRQEWRQHNSGVWLIPEDMRKREAFQQPIFHELAGQWMGTNAKRGNTYTWLPNHLGDGFGKVSPRSFLAALREAAEEDMTAKDQKFPLHYQAINKGVRKASQIRVNELKDDYPWMDTVCGALKGMMVPSDFAGIKERWQERQIKDKLQPVDDDESVRLPPSRSQQGDEGLKDDLVALGVFTAMRDGRINMPDLYRVGYGLKRRGGLPPVK